MDIAVLTFEGFNELDSFIASSILNRMKDAGWNVQITSPSKSVTSMNGVTVQSQKPLEFANRADVVLFGSGAQTRNIAQDQDILSRLKLDPRTQLIGGQCSGTLLMSVLGLLHQVPACTDLTTKPWVIESGVTVLEQPFYARGNIATAGGCLSSKYLAAWVIGKLSGREDAESAIHYVAPVGEKESTVQHCMSVIEEYL
ncbi:DJ-1/PfpI family protein [Vibrio europaeus]|uniref:AraC family transcriptional regulator n=1 Tax=Vibrio europaeus TaxID=300876 RepID=A0AAE7DYT6_9VIBR|nr:DJ-1/PfpI family protein [Vibrio europaeus]MDC5812552.1 DJ-1/PfpI family protein [Vibrio europaeus]MDC5852383.1 DJ-1/PfpI family protein [Vibrio europaeus]QJY38949.1 AraC family transcriptional regulator [Vibrio europaeus]QPG33967.1 DJ-1/PfpI family protein [Vibrio europaeus]